MNVAVFIVKMMIAMIALPIMLLFGCMIGFVSFFFSWLEMVNETIIGLEVNEK